MRCGQPHLFFCLLAKHLLYILYIRIKIINFAQILQKLSYVDDCNGASWLRSLAE